MTEDETLILIDASGFIYRAYHATPNLTRKDGQETGGVVGYSAMLWNILRSPPTPYTHMAAVFDVPREPGAGPDWRRELYPNYKAGRGEKSSAISSQIRIVREGTPHFGVAVLGSPGVEADDIIATYARRAVSVGMDVVVISHDKDLWQLIRPGVRVYNSQPHKRAGGFYPEPHWITHEEIRDKFCVDDPRLIPDVQGLAGDGTDGFKGIPNLGPKKAGPLIERYGSLEALLDNIDDVGNAAQRDALRTHGELARTCKRLAMLHAGVDLDVPLDALRRSAPTQEAVIGFLDSMEIIELRARVLEEWDRLPSWIAAANMQREVDA